MISFRGENLQLTIGCEADARQSCEKLIQSLGHPEKTPPEELFVKPTWTTWAGLKTDVSQERVLHFAEEILEHGYPYGVMEIDDRWQTHYGDFTFDPFRFPSPARMIRALHNIGFKVTTWIIPFFAPESSAYQKGKEKGYFVKNALDEVYPVTWWQGEGALLDVTNPSALHWFYDNLRALQRDTGLDGFKFDAGEACFLPQDAITQQPITRNEYTHRYIQFISENFSLTEVRSGWLNQQSPIFFRQWDKWSTWGADNGLHSVISGILSLGLTGYHFVLPDMVGGNAYDVFPDAELMIRWTQLNALLPAIQFSLRPWEYGLECNEICRRYAELHIEYSDVILDLARNAAQTGEPIIRPIWWRTPMDKNALVCDDQFLLGDDFLVAPVIEKGALSRRIYLPKGKWKDIQSGELFEGERYLSEYPAPLEVLPVFERVAD
jgi:alpha-glucosidase (family GH31 glycosyl hydrolase)